MARAHLAAVTGEIPTSDPGINSQQPGTTVDPYAPPWKQVLQWYAAVSAQAGAKSVGASPADQAKAGYEASKAPLQAPVEMAKKAVAPLNPWPSIQTWLEKEGRVVGIYGIFLVLGIIGLVFLLSAAGVKR